MLNFNSKQEDHFEDSLLLSIKFTFTKYKNTKQKISLNLEQQKEFKYNTVNKLRYKVKELYKIQMNQPHECCLFLLYFQAENKQDPPALFQLE